MVTLYRRWRVVFWLGLTCVALWLIKKNMPPLKTEPYMECIDDGLGTLECEYLLPEPNE